MTTSSQAISDVLAGQRGQRPYSLPNPEVEQVLNIALALLVELSTTNERVDQLEREVAALRGQSLAEYRSQPVEPEVQQERQQAVDALQMRVLRVMLDPRAGV